MKSPRTRATLAAAALCIPVSLAAQPAAPDFAQLPVPKAAELSERLNGVWTTRLANGVGWRMDFRDNGFLYMDVSNGARDTGKWRTEDGRVCFEFRQFPSSCSPWRIAGERLYVKRDSGEVLTLQKQP